MKICLFSLLAITVALGSQSTAFAGLGDPEESVETDAASLKAVHHALTPGTRVHSHDLTIAGKGIVTHEYANSDGRVFAITWSGRSMPDMSIMLSKYFREYQKNGAHSKRAHGRAPFHLSTDHIEFDVAGHFGSLKGRAYLPALVPDGTNVDGLE